MTHHIIIAIDLYSSRFLIKMETIQPMDTLHCRAQWLKGSGGSASHNAFDNFKETLKLDSEISLCKGSDSVSWCCLLCNKLPKSGKKCTSCANISFILRVNKYDCSQEETDPNGEKQIFNLEAKIESQVNICRLKSYKELKLIVIM